MNTTPRKCYEADDVKKGGNYFNMYSHLYGQKIKMNDRFESEHIWSEKLALKNRGRWTPALIDTKPIPNLPSGGEMPHIPLKEENPKGLHAKYLIRKIVGWKQEGFFGMKAITKAVDENAEYFVMRLDEGGKDIEHIKACRVGVNAYADAIENHLPELAKDLRERYPLLT